MADEQHQVMMLKRAPAADHPDFPFVSEMICDRHGRISKVILTLPKYRALVEAVTDAGLLKAIDQTRKDKALTRDQAVKVLGCGAVKANR